MRDEKAETGRDTVYTNRDRWRYEKTKTGGEYTYRDRKRDK